MGMVYGVRVELHVDFSHSYSHVYLVSRVTVKQLTVDMSLLLQNVISIRPQKPAGPIPGQRWLVKDQPCYPQNHGRS